MLRRIAANAILNSPMSTSAVYIDDVTGAKHEFRVVIHNEFNKDWDQNVSRNTEISYRPEDEVNLVTGSLITIYLADVDRFSYWQVGEVISYNGSLTRVALKPVKEIPQGRCE